MDGAVLNSYRAAWSALYARQLWPRPGESRYEERAAACWDDLRPLLIEHIYRLMAEADAFAVDLEAILAVRVGSEWWSEEKIDAVEKLLDSLISLPTEP